MKSLRALNLLVLPVLIVSLQILSSAAIADSSVKKASIGFEKNECQYEIQDYVTDLDRLSCATLSVPLDYSGAVAGRIELNVDRFKSRSKTSSTTEAVVALAGGPGQGASLYIQDFSEILRAAMGQRDLIVFDQRGTGFSDPLGCRALEKATIEQTTDAAEECAQKLGASAPFYTTEDSVEDLEAIRQELGVEKLVLFGVSYGTKVAEAYAIKYPTHVSKMILDSVVLPDGPDNLTRNSFTAAPRILDALCTDSRCKAVTDTPKEDLAALVTKMNGQSLSGTWIDKFGRPQTETINSYDIFSQLAAGDFDPYLRAAMPAAIKGALDGDTAPLLRLVQNGESVESPGPVDRADFSVGLYAATTCEDTNFPWTRGASYDARIAELSTYLDAQSAASFAPFDRAAAEQSDGLLVCKKWPISTNDRTVPAGPLPAVPTLIVSGESDIRTPLEDAKTLQAAIPGSTLLEVPDVGHSTVTQDSTLCAFKQVENFLKGKTVDTTCKRGSAPATIEKVAPTSLSTVSPALKMKGKVGRTLGAFQLTINDFVSQATTLVLSSDPFSSGTLRGGGLRGGSFSLGYYVKLKNYEFVPGVKVTGKLAVDGREHLFGNLKVTGSAAAKGKIRIRGYRVSGKLGGKYFRGKLDRDVVSGLAVSSSIKTLSNSVKSWFRFRPIGWNHSYSQKAN